MSPSPLHGMTLKESRLKSDHGLTVVGLQRSSGMRTLARSGDPNTMLRSGDVLLLLKDRGVAMDVGELGLALLNKKELSSALENELGVVEVMVPPRSDALGKSVVELGFRRTYRLSVFGIMHKGELITENMGDHELAMGDTLLLGGSWVRIHEMRQSREFMVLQMPSEWRDLAPTYEKAPWALGIMGGMLFLMIFNLVPAVVAVLMAAVAMILMGCLSMDDAYEAINWQSLVLIAGLLPMATALDVTGGLTFIVDHLMTGLGGLGPYGIMAILFLLTAVFSQFISNTATTVLVAPIAIGIGEQLGVSPYPLVMAVAIAASAAFVTPVASPVNTLVLGPGGYKFSDFVKVGLPLLFLTLVITMLVVPLILPFDVG
jgi:di/tricarboxylate transporter